MANWLRLANTLNDAANAWLPAEYAFGYHLAHDCRLRADDPALDATPEDLTVLDEGCAEMLTIWRARLTRDAAAGVPGAADDLAALPTSGRYLLAEIVHLPTGIRAVKTYAYATIRDLITDPTKTNAQKRTAVRNALAALYQTCQDRVAAAT